MGGPWRIAVCCCHRRLSSCMPRRAPRAAARRMGTGAGLAALLLLAIARLCLLLCRLLLGRASLILIATSSWLRLLRLPACCRALGWPLHGLTIPGPQSGPRRGQLALLPCEVWVHRGGLGRTARCGAARCPCCPWCRTAGSPYIADRQQAASPPRPRRQTSHAEPASSRICRCCAGTSNCLRLLLGGLALRGLSGRRLLC